MSKSCTWNRWGAGNSPEELSNIREAIFQVVVEEGLSPLEAENRRRFYLVIVLQESRACVRVPTTNNGVRNPGLMQDHNGQGTCNENGSIKPMVQQGTQGPPSGDGFKQLIAKARGIGAQDAQAHYMVARMYNSGSMAADSNLSNDIGSASPYASDVAHRLTSSVK